MTRYSQKGDILVDQAEQVIFSSPEAMISQATVTITNKGGARIAFTVYHNGNAIIGETILSGNTNKIVIDIPFDKLTVFALPDDQITAKGRYLIQFVQ